MPSYQFYLDSCEIMDTRSFHEDTIVAGLGCIVNQTVHNSTVAAQVGDHNNGKFVFWQQGLGSLDQVEIGEDDQFVFIYQLYNNGQAGRPSVADVQAYIDRDLLGASNELLATTASANDLKQVSDAIAQIDTQIAQIMAQLQNSAPNSTATAGKTANLGRMGRLANRVVTNTDPNAALKQQLQDLEQKKKALLAQLIALKGKGTSFSVLMPGPDWRNDGPFTSGDYSVLNYSRGKLISILGNIILAGCDGPLAFGFVAGIGSELEKRIPAVGPLRLSGEFKAGDLGWSVPCNPAGSHYVVNTIIQRQ